MLGFAIGSDASAIRLPDAKVAGARILFDQLREKAYSSAIESHTLQKVRRPIGHVSAPNSMWELVAGPVDTLLRYTDVCAIFVNCPALGVWQAF